MTTINIRAHVLYIGVLVGALLCARNDKNTGLSTMFECKDNFFT